jgi:hypothetical protein
MEFPPAASRTGFSGGRLRPPQAELRAAHDSLHKVGKPDIIIIGSPFDLRQRGLVTWLQSPADRVDEEFSGQSADEFLAMDPQVPAEARDTIEGPAGAKVSTVVHRSTVRIAIAEPAERVESFEREAEGVHPAMAAGTGRVGPVSFQPLAEGDDRLVLCGLLQRRHLRGRRRRRGVE